VAILYTDGLHWLEKSAWASAIRQADWVYPALEIGHITGIVLLAGAAFLFDLRLLGFSKNLPVTELARHLLPWSRRGLLLIIPTGFLLFITNAVALGQDPVFWLKLALLVAAGLNATLFHAFTLPTAAAWNIDQLPPARAKIAALSSIMLWLAIISCGRLLAY
jgi:hypothetical protein